MSTEVHEAHASRDHGRVVRLVLAAVLVAAVIAVAIDNREEVEVGYVVGEVRAPVWIILVAAGVAGVLIGWLIKHRPRHHH